MNKDLYDNTYAIPKDVLEFITIELYKNPNHNGNRRARNILKTKSLTYSSLKRMKNFFDYNSKDKDEIEFNLNGGVYMKDFIESTLKSERGKTKISKELKRDINLNNNI